MNSMVRCVVGVCGVALLLSAPARAGAQSLTVGGVVVDESGGAVIDARVDVIEGAGTARPRTTTDGNGRFTVTALPEGRLVLSVTKPLFRTERVEVDATGDSATPLRVVLALDTVTENVSVVSSIIDANATDEFGALRTVVSDAQVRNLNAVDLASALRRTPGVTISRFNPVGAFGGTEGGAVYIRGIGASRPGSEIKAYIDGVPFYMGVWGHPLLDLLPVNGIDRITVVKGPQPQSAGNNFSGIDITPRRARGEAVDGNIRLIGGSFGTAIEQADLSGRHGNVDYSVAQGFARSSGHRDDADGRLFNGMGRLGYRVNEHWSVSGMVLGVDNRASDPGEEGKPDTKAGQYLTSGTLGSVEVAHEYPRASGSVRFYANRGEGNWFNQPGLDGDTLTSFSLSGAQLRERISPWANGQMNLGLDVDRIGGDVAFNRVAPAPTAQFDGPTLSLTSPTLSIVQTVPLGSGWTLQPSAGVRLYHHSDLESSTAPFAGVQLRNASNVAFRFNASRGISYPGLDVVVLSSLIPPLGETWRDLAPERLDHIEGGMSVSPTSATTVDVSIFRDHLKDRYVFGFPPAVSFPMFANLGDYSVRGIEMSLQQRVADTWNIFAGLTLLDPTLESLPYAPKHSAVFGLTGAARAFRLSADAQYQSSMLVFGQERAAGAVNSASVDGLTVFNVRPAVLLPGTRVKAEVFVAIENLFNQDYEYRPGYPMPGTSVQVGISLGRSVR